MQNLLNLLPVVPVLVALLLMIAVLTKAFMKAVRKKGTAKDRYNEFQNTFTVVDTGVYSNANIQENIKRHNEFLDEATKFRNITEKNLKLKFL